MLDDKPRDSGNESNQTDPLNPVNSSKYDPVGTTGGGIAENKGSNINTCFVFGHTVTIALGFA